MTDIVAEKTAFHREVLEQVEREVDFHQKAHEDMKLLRLAIESE